MHSERVTLRFRKQQDGTFEIDRFHLEDNGRSRLTVWRDASIPADGNFGTPDSVRVLMLALVRVAQYRFLRVTAPSGEDIPIFRETTGSTVFGKFRNLHEGARKSSDHGSKWLQQMLSLKGDLRGYEVTGRLDRWFAVSRRKPGGVVTCDLTTLPPESLHITVEDKAVDEAELDCIESSLALRLGAGLPCLLEMEGVRVMGRPPSIRPEWYEQEAECEEADAVYARGEVPILCVLGPSWTGKTVFASRWLRRLIGNRKTRHRLIFAWSFSRQGASHHIQLPSLQFFHELAAALEVTLPEKASPVEQAVVILETLERSPAFLFLDGVEVTFARPNLKDSDRLAAEYDTGLARLLSGIAARGTSFVLATTQVDFTQVFRIPVKKIQPLRVSESAMQLEVDALLAELGGDQVGDIDTAGQAVAIADLCRVLKETAALPGGVTSEAFIRATSTEPGPLYGYSGAIAGEELSPEKKRILNLILARLHGTCAQLLLFVISVAMDRISESDLLAVVEKLPLAETGLGRTEVTMGEWTQGLDTLVASTILKEAVRHVGYSIHGERGRYITESLKRNSPALWVSINTSLGELLLARSPQKVLRREEIPPLVEAAIYFCQAGRRQMAYEEIAFKRLYHGLKGYAIFHLGEYDAPKAINAAILHRDPDLADVTPVPPDIFVLGLHTHALCTRYLNQLPQALEQEKDAWKRAKLVGTSSVVLPIGFNLLRLCHMFGKLKEAREVEWRMFRRLIADGVRSKVFRRPLDLNPEDVVDGASAVSSMLALSMLYRGGGEKWPCRILEAGIKACRDHGDPVPFLLPSFGRPWHALALLEMGRWEKCERAFNANEWFSDAVRFQQTGTFEVLAARLFLAKALAGSEATRAAALETADLWAGKAVGKAVLGEYRWWEAFSLIARARIFVADGQKARAAQSVTAAQSICADQSFPLLEIDALMVKAELDKLDKRPKEALAIARRALDLSRTIGYGLRKPALEKLIASAK